MITRPLYRSLEVSAVEAWVVARASVCSGKTANAKIVHTEADGIYDRMIISMANSYRVTGANSIESRIPTDSLTLNLLVFKIADGKLGICFPHNDDARYVGSFQSGNAWIGILKNGEWKTVTKSSRR